MQSRWVELEQQCAHLLDRQGDRLFQIIDDAERAVVLESALEDLQLDGESDQRLQRIVVDLVGDAPTLVLLGAQEQLRELAALLVEPTLFRDVPDQREDVAGTVRFRHDTGRRHDRVHGVALGALVTLIELGRRRVSREQPVDDGVRPFDVVGEREVVEVPADDLVSRRGEDARERRVRGDIATVGPDDLDPDREIVDELGEDVVASFHAPTQEADAGAQHDNHGGGDDPLPGGDGRTAVPEPPGRAQDRAGDRRGVDALGDAGTHAQHGEGRRCEPAQKSEDVPRPEPVDIGADPRGPGGDEADEWQLPEVRARQSPGLPSPIPTRRYAPRRRCIHAQLAARAPPKAPRWSPASPILGPRGLLTDPADTAPYGEDWRQLYRGRPLAVARPADTAEVAAVVRASWRPGSGWCRRAATPPWSAAP